MIELKFGTRVNFWIQILNFNFTLIFNGLKNPIHDFFYQLWNAKLNGLGKNEKKQTSSISIAAGNYDTEIIIDLINQTIQDFQVKYQEPTSLCPDLKTLPIFSPLGYPIFYP